MVIWTLGFFIFLQQNADTLSQYTESYVVLAYTNEQILFQYYCFNSIVINFCNQKRKRLFLPNFQIK